MANHTTWILAADSSRARVFEMQGRNGDLREIEDFTNPGGRAHSRDLHTDAHGRYHGPASGGVRTQGNSAMEPTDPVEHETEMFSKSLGEYLDKARAENRYSELCLIAPPKFLGMIRRNLSRESQKLVGKEIVKHLARLDPGEIEAYVKG